MLIYNLRSNPALYGCAKFTTYWTMVITVIVTDTAVPFSHTCPCCTWSTKHAARAILVDSSAHMIRCVHHFWWTQEWCTICSSNQYAFSLNVHHFFWPVNCHTPNHMQTIPNDPDLMDTWQHFLKYYLPSLLELLNNLTLD